MHILYENIENLLNIYKIDFDYIFQTMFENGTYNYLGLVFIFVPLVLLLAFYLIWKYPYGKLWHWILYVIIIAVIVGAVSWQVTYSAIFNSGIIELEELINSNTDGYADFAFSLLPKYALINSVLAIFVSFIYSLILKRFSKIQIHLPF